MQPNDKLVIKTDLNNDTNIFYVDLKIKIITTDNYINLNLKYYLQEFKMLLFSLPIK